MVPSRENKSFNASTASAGKGKGEETGEGWGLEANSVEANRTCQLEQDELVAGTSVL